MKDQELVNALRYLCPGNFTCARCEYEPVCHGDGCAIIQKAADRIANQSTHIAALQQEIEKLRAQLPRWIPVEERLPSGDNQVLVVVSGKPKENITLAGAVELATLYSDGWCLETWPEWTGAEVTHWMPIPETPEPPEEAGHD